MPTYRHTQKTRKGLGSTNTLGTNWIQKKTVKNLGHLVLCHTWHEGRGHSWIFSGLQKTLGCQTSLLQKQLAPPETELLLVVQVVECLLLLFNLNLVEWKLQEQGLVQQTHRVPSYRKTMKNKNFNKSLNTEEVSTVNTGNHKTNEDFNSNVHGCPLVVWQGSVLHT